MQQLLMTLFECSFSMSIISLAYMAAMPFLSKRYAAKWLYYGWLALVTGWIFPFRSILKTVLLSARLPIVQIIPAEYFNPGKLFAANINNKTGAVFTLSPWKLGTCVWIVGMIGITAYHIWRHKRFWETIHRWSEDVRNLQILDILIALKKEMNIKTRIDLKTCPCIGSPMMIGFFRPTILLPAIKFNYGDLTYILRHELVHFKRKDLWYKTSILLVTIIHWFNPIVYLMAKAVAVQCEISCDEQLLKGATPQQRQEYGKIIIDTIANAVRDRLKYRPTLSTSFYGGKKSIETRISSIMDTSKKRVGIIVVCIILIAIIGMGSIFAFDSSGKSEDTGMQGGGTKIPPHFEYGEGNTITGALADFGFLEYDEAEQVHRFNGKWVRTVYDYFIWNGEQFWELSSIPGSYSGEPIDLKIIRNPKTNAIEKLKEMSKLETREAWNYRPDWFEKVLDGSEGSNAHILRLDP